MTFLHTLAVEDMVRNSMGEEHLTGLATMNIHRDIHLDVNGAYWSLQLQLQEVKNSICFVHVVVKVKSVFYFL